MNNISKLPKVPEKVKCIYSRCSHCMSVDDGEDENGCPYPPNLYCTACDYWLEDYPYESYCPDPSKMKVED